jgi:SEC10/PgrA surface exclusion-like protein/LPXTG-motif cell wall-anchored protein
MKETNNKMKFIAGTAAIVAAACATGVVNADEVTVTTPDTNAVSETQAQSTVTEQQVSDAKQNMEKAETAAVIQESATGLAQNQANDAQSQVNAAQSQVTDAQATAAKATPEALAQATNAITTADSHVPVAEKAVTEAQATATNAQTAVTNQEAVVSDAKAAADKAQAKSDTAKAKADALAKESTDVSTAQDNVTVAEATVVRAKSDVKTAETSLETAKKADSQLDQAISSATRAVSTAEQGVKAAEQTVSDKEAALSQAQTAFGQAKAATEAVKPLATWESKVNIPEEYLNALKKWVNAKGEDRVKAADEAFAIYDALPITTDSNIINQYTKIVHVYDGDIHYDANDNGICNYFYPDTITVADNTQYDVENLPENVNNIVNQYFVDQVNAFRRALGLPDATVNTLMMDLAKARAVKYNALRDNTDETGSDYSIELSTKKPELEHLYVRENLTNQRHFKPFSGDLAYKRSHYATLSEILEGVREAVFLFTVDDGKDYYSHTASLTDYDQQGISMYLQDNSNSFIEVPAEFNVVTTTSSLHEAKFAQDIWGGHVYDVLSAGRANFEPSVDAYNKVVLKQTTAGVALKAAQEDVTVAKTAVTTAQKAVDDAKAKVAELESRERQTPKAEAELRAAQAKLTEAEGKLAVAKVVLASVTAEEATKAQALAQAKEDAKIAKEKADNAMVALATEQAKLADLKSSAEKANNDVVAAQKALNNAKSAVEAAKAHKSELENAQAKLAAAQVKLAAAQVKLVNAQAKLAAEQAKLTDARSKYASAKSEYETVLTKYEVQKALDDAKKGNIVTPDTKPESGKTDNTKPETDVVKPNQGAKAKYDDVVAPKVVSSQVEAAPVSVSKFNKTQEQTVNTVAEATAVAVKAGHGHTLPETGDNGGVIASVAGIGLLGLLGFAGRKRKKN